MLSKKMKFHYFYDLDCNDKMSQSQKEKFHQCTIIIERIIKTNIVVNIKNYDDND